MERWGGERKREEEKELEGRGRARPVPMKLYQKTILKNEASHHTFMTLSFKGLLLAT